ncbi:exostosin-like 3 isoform X2 [Watersipora subatra]
MNCWRMCGGWRSRTIVIIFLIVFLFIISTFVGMNVQEPSIEVSLNTFNQLANKDDFFHHVEDMQRLRKSIIVELGNLESERNRLRSSVESLSRQSTDYNNELKTLERNLLQIKFNIQNALVSQDEALKEYSSIKLPLRLLPQSERTNHASPTGECRLQTCFDYSRCSVTSGFSIYLYPLVTDNNLLLLWKSALLNSGYITDNPDAVCIYLALVEREDFQAQELKYWSGDGRNHVIVSVFPNSYTVPKSRAMHAQVIWRKYSPVTGFDIMLPYSHLEEVKFHDLPLMLPVRRPNLLSFLGKSPSVTNEQEKNFIAAFRLLTSPDLSINIEVDCQAIQPCTTNQWCLCSSEDMVENEINSTFIVVLNARSMPSDQFSYRLYQALVKGAVPVILGDEHTLPLDELIPWHTAALLLPLQRVTELVYILRNILEPDIIEFKKQGRAIFENYLMSTPRIAEGLLELLRQRINIPPTEAPLPESEHIYTESNPMPMFETRVEPNDVLGPVEDQYPSAAYQRNFTSGRSLVGFFFGRAATRLYPHTPWDPILPTDAKFHGSPYGFRPINGGAGGSGKEFSQALGGNHPREQFTIVILTYDRADLLQQQLAQFNGLPYLNKVLIVWNNPNYPPATFQWPHIHVPIQVLKSARNSLNNRFLPYKEIETEAILSLDDDMYLRHDEIIFAFRVWREYRDRIVGFPGRYHAWNERDNKWNYNSNHSCELSLILTGAAFLHKYYLYQYSYFMARAIRDKVDEFMNCEDIAMNFLVSHLTGKPPVKTTSRWTFRCSTCGEASLWTDESHFRERHECIQYFTQIYGYLPLMYTQLRTDSVLFKTRVPQNKTKCFSLV